MDLKAKLAVLDRIYEIYDDFSNRLAVACKRRCSMCCTSQVTVTTIEGYKIVSHLKAAGKPELFETIRLGKHEEPIQHLITTNTIADLCVRGNEVPDEPEDFPKGVCPLLTDDECPVYPVRPFGCRCFVSTKTCREDGWAEVDPFVLTVNTLFMQYIEHLDQNGASGNMTDVVHFLESEENRAVYRRHAIQPIDGRLAANRPISVLMIPPEHQGKIQPILDRIRRIKVVRASCD
jgi:hypothetical protein